MEIEIFSILIWVLSIICLIEILAYVSISYTNKKFQWLIMQKDENPKLSKEGLEKFFEHGYDSELGWIRKPNTTHEEKGKEGITKWTINDYGGRNNLEFEKINSKISTYGDSFTFCRQVNDDGTWQHWISKLQNTNVKNFGVGNYGLDQTLLRLKREFPNNKTETVIIGVVPDTISRIVSIWKHYYEYGNTFGFKPRFILKNEILELLKNPIDDKTKFIDYRDYINEIKKNDFFYKKKFLKEKLYFPYSLLLFKNMKRNFSLIFWIFLTQIYKKIGKDTTKIEWKPMRIIMQINLKWRIELYENKKTVDLFRKIIEEFVSYSKRNNFKPMFVFLPQKDDILFIRKHKHFYEEFVNDISKIENLVVVDIAKNLIPEENLDELYSDQNDYGGHYSELGNKKIANLLDQKLRNIV
ncbi:MAG: hypothetical protein CMH74_00060 [Nitrospina sp.]|nr:hypothetical protein [Nitrospina sp.]|tara:strand:+ start:233 stop:1468 length:1236 start_codon:yes stop_codon:yes gene_type:complete